MPGRAHPRWCYVSLQARASRRAAFVGLTAIVCVLFLHTTSARAQNPPVTISVDANANRRPIDPNIYGVAHASTAELTDLNSPLNRNGGNNTTRYNWQLNADNRGNDWYYESIAESSATAGERGDTFIANARAANARAMLTVPTIEWVARVGPNRIKLPSFSVAKYGAQTGTDWQWFPDAGNGVRTNGQFVTSNDPNDANVPSTSLFQQGWVQHLVTRWGTNANGGLRYYILDNEPSIWHSTHRDVRPTSPTMNEIRDKTIDFALKIKAVDPTALVVGPEDWGWSGYFYSGYDQQYGSLHGWGSLPDRANHGGADYLPWFLDQMRQQQTSSVQRLLDVFTVHYYPQGGEFSDDVSTAMQLRRNRSTRSLWDPGYVDETWINDRVQLVPRLKSWVNTYYPGTAIGITEYNWGAENHINGATTQADVFGIFGREGLDMGARWATPASSTPTYKAMKMYRNYDGNRSTFGDVSVAASVPNPDNVAAFAASRSADGALTVMVISKYLSTTTQTTISLANVNHRGVAQAWQLTSANAITRLSDLTLSGNSIVATLPAQSITLFVVPANGTATPPQAPTNVRIVREQ
ncbi:MAG TPA: glycoside hydrolase family 44 protein [Vicinamibacterales bacterium]